jgi:hypothetical protein
MKNTKQPGTVSEAKVAAALLQKGKTVLVPMGDGERYDLVFTSPWAKADFQRVQCKTARMSNGNVKFDIRSSSCGKHADYRGQVEYFGVYYPVNGKCYLVPVKQCGVSSTTLILNRPGDALAAGKYEL